MNIKKGYKLFEQREDGALFPLFIGKHEETPINKWVPAQIIEYHPSFAHRPGWHCGTKCPSAPWLMSADGTYKSQRGKKFKRVWCEVEYIADIDYTEIDKRLNRTVTKGNCAKTEEAAKEHLKDVISEIKIIANLNDF